MSNGFRYFLKKNLRFLHFRFFLITNAGFLFKCIFTLYKDYSYEIHRYLFHMENLLHKMKNEGK